MEYVVENKRFILNYQELRESYMNFCAMPDGEFEEKLPQAIHLACVICFLKEIPTYLCLSDNGIIHELAHALTETTLVADSFGDMRKLFENQLKLS